MIIKALQKTILEALNKCIAEENWKLNSTPEIIIERPKEKVNGDFSTNIAMILASQTRMNPRKISASLIANLKQDSSFIDKVDVAGPGFINIFISPSTWRDEVKDIYFH